MVCLLFIHHKIINMIKNNIVLLLMVTVFFSCACSKESTDINEENVFTYWVGASKVPCTGVGPMQCMLVKKGVDFDALKWTNFYDTIIGFDYKPGYVYKLKVKEEKIPLDQIPADASSIKYTLIKVLEKNLQPGTLLNDIWVLEKIGTTKIAVGSGRNRTPQIEINLAQNRFFGNDGCNNMMGSLKLVDDKNLEFGRIAGTRMACTDMENPYKFTQALAKTKTYTIENLKLILLDIDGIALLQFQKID